MPASTQGDGHHLHEGRVTTTMERFEAIDTTCMRCGRPAQLRFAGPCGDCMTELSVRFPGVARQVEAEEYIPKVNVTANAVALKDD